MRSGTARSEERDGRSNAAYFEWSPAGHATSIYLSFAVMDQIEAGVMKGFWSVPKRGAEVGGVLFGRTRVTETEATVYIDEFEPVECEHRRGPSFVLSDPDKRRLERTLRRGRPGREVVGFYRSHTRLGLYLDQDDFTLIQNYFPGPSQVFLLVRPHASKASAGGFFFWEEGTIHRQATYLEFPFSRSEILKHSGAALEARELEPEPPPQQIQASAARSVVQNALARTAARPRAAVPPIPWSTYVERARAFLKKAAQEIKVQARRLDAQVRRLDGPVRDLQLDGHARRIVALVRDTAVRRPLAAGAVVGTVVLLCLVLLQYGLRKERVAPEVVIHDTAGAPALRIERNGRYMHVRWDRNAPTVVNAERGLLEITDGTIRRELQLDSTQLRTGSVAYSPSSDDVNFRLELVGAKGTFTESLRVVEGANRAGSHSITTDPPPPPAENSVTQPAANANRTVIAQRLPQKSAPSKPAPKRAPRTPARAWVDDGL